MNTVCENCKFWSQEGDIPGTGICRRYAPRPTVTRPSVGSESVDGIWPRTKGEEWCGEWQAKVET